MAIGSLSDSISPHLAHRIELVLQLILYRMQDANILGQIFVKIGPRQANSVDRFWIGMRHWDAMVTALAINTRAMKT
jgi:hypothetical protein